MKQRIARLVTFALCLALTVSAIPATVLATELTEGDFTYAVSEDGTAAIVTAYNGNATAVTVPDTLGGLPVTKIGEYAFEMNDTVQTVVFPSTLKAIGYGAFNACASLTAANIPNAVTAIEAMAFYNCTSLNAVNVGPYTLYIGSQAFHNTAWIGNQSAGPLYIGRVLYTYIGQVPVGGTVTVKPGTATVAPYAFSGQKQLTAVYLPVGLRTVHACAFLNCTRLIEARIPPSVTTIESGAFLNANATAIHSTYDAAAYTYAKENSLYFEYDETLDYPDGDMNRDKVVNTSDLRIVLRHLLDNSFPCDEERLLSCDLVYDGEITTLDVRQLLQQLLTVL